MNPIVESDGTKNWKDKGQLHRTDEPVVVYGTKYWFKNDKLHRTDGPAVVHPDGREKWFVNGEEVPRYILLWKKRLK